MGKNNKVKVSIVTITQIKRQETIKVTVDLIKNQTHKKIIEWVIVEGSTNLSDCLENEKFISMLQSSVPIKYISGYTTDQSGNMVFNNNKLGNLRNIGNTSCTGDVTVVFDDDDFYPPTRVEHAVSMLMNSKALIAGCSEKYLYDYCLERLFKFKSFGPNHSTNDCMAWKKEYLLQNSHDPSVSNAEEASFTKKFANQMVQLDAKQCIIGSSHSHNTFNKKEICITGCLWRNASNPSEGYMYPNIVHPEETVVDIMGTELFERYKSIYNTNEVSEFDISYFCGGTSIAWDPTSKSLGGSEQAIVHLATEWTKMGKKVAVYTKLSTTVCFYNGISFFNWNSFPFHKKHSVVILWRMSGINSGLLFPIKTDKLFIDFHDNNFVFRHPYLPYINKVDRIFFKSEYHLKYYESHFNIKVPEDRYAIIPNGLRVNDFELINTNICREPFRFCYCSCYTRGLAELLTYVWPIIFRYEPRAEFHVYYGMDSLQDRQKQELMLLLGQPGVMDHGRRPVEEIAKEKWKSSFQLYITDTNQEIDCISIRESLLTGCIPLISKSGVFKTRDGIHFNLENGYEKIAQGILNLISNPEMVHLCRQKLRNSKTIVDCKEIGINWLEYF